MTSKERQDILSNFYGFKCLCPFCVSEDDTRQSEPTRVSKNLDSISLPSFEKWCLDHSFPDDILINAHKHALQSAEQEDISTTKSKHLDAIAMCYGALEDVDNFRIWMERVSEVRSRVKPEQKVVFSKWLSNPTTFPVWGWRRVFCGEDQGDQEGDSDSGLSSCVSMGMFEGVIVTS